ncbi:hypothetical protein VIGAN_10242100 [Vigna angularis var. angularis]|uniref:EGF-like domain-containing protein n=1 Tax=Vigna angularis var. angularis TaxID=157739 RepID=A0A0S3T6B3_PHAAN|nr:hypothetical protein VIGAN_10242100 [Vigna angularis var. angularis]
MPMDQLTIQLDNTVWRSSQIIFNMTTEVVGAIEDYYHRVLVDDKGNFQKLIYHKENGSEWRSVWQAVTKPCTVTALCRVYGFCNTSGSNTQTYSCGCLPGYTKFFCLKL